MMVNIYPSKLMEINVIVWSCQKQQKKKISQAVTPQKGKIVRWLKASEELW